MSSPQVLIFEPDGTGQIWWVHTEEALAEGGHHRTFEWTVENGHLIVNDLPPAETVSNGLSSVVVQEPNGEPTDAAVWSRCGESLEVPEVLTNAAAVTL